MYLCQSKLNAMFVSAKRHPDLTGVTALSLQALVVIDL